MCVNIIYVCICLYCVICLILYYRSLLICTNKEFMNNELDKNPNKDPNYNYEILSTLLQNAKSKHIPKRISKFNKRRHKKQKWMTDELLAQIVTKNEMYVDWKTTPVMHTDHERVKLRFKGYEKLVLKEIEKLNISTEFLRHIEVI